MEVRFIIYFILKNEVLPAFGWSAGDFIIIILSQQHVVIGIWSQCGRLVAGQPDALLGPVESPCDCEDL